MRWKSAPNIACAPASRNSRMPMAAIMSCSSGALRSGWKTSCCASMASTATAAAAASMASQ